MEIVRYFFISGIILALVWTFALLAGFLPQIKRMQKNWIENTREPAQQNIVITKVFGYLGLSRADRLTCTLFIYNALMLWPITLIVATPLIKVFRARELNHMVQERANLNELPYPSSSPSTHLTSDRAKTDDTVLG